MKVSLIAAVAENGAIGKDNDLIWHLPDDLKFFKKTTGGKPVIMGRKNYESIPAKFRPLPNRQNIVITRHAEYRAPGCAVVPSLDAAFDQAENAEEVFIIGGGQIFDLVFERGVVDQIYITEVHHSFDGDVFFPDFDLSKWKKKVLSTHPKDEKHDYAFTFTVYTKK